MKLVTLYLVAIVLFICTFARAESDLDYQPSFEKPQENDDEVPYPFRRTLKVGDSGKDVFTLQRLINRWSRQPNVPVTQVFDDATAKAVKSWKSFNNLPNTAVFDAPTAFKFLEQFQYDGYKDRGIKARDMGLKFRIYIPVYKNRAKETTATLYDADNNVLHKWRTRTRAHTVYGEEEWPAYDSEGSGLNEFTSWGYTPSGLSLVDLNTPEPESVFHLYGEWEVLRAVRGIEGNAEICMPYLRNGILAHTGRWEPSGWEPTKDMPNSSGCMHNHPQDQKTLVELLKAKGVIANENPFGKLPYPFEPQGLLSIEVIPDEVEF